MLDYGVTPETHRLAVIWKVRDDAKDVQAVLLQVAHDSTFTTEVRLHLVPASITRADLDVGGTERWFFRLGAVIGSLDAGQVHWTSVYGPVPVRSEKPMLAESAEDVSGITLHALQGAVRILFPLSAATGYVFAELAGAAEFPYASTRWFYGRIDATTPPSMDVGGIVSAPDRHYWLRLHHLPNPDLGLAAKTMRQLKRIATVADVRSAALVRGADSSVLTADAASAAIVRDVQTSGRPASFPTHADYMRYMAARQKF